MKITSLGYSPINQSQNHKNKQQNFSSVRLMGTEVAEISEAGVKSLLSRMKPSLKPQEILEAFQHLVKVDELLSPQDTFKVGIALADVHLLKVFGDTERIAQPCSACTINVFPVKGLAQRLADTYCVLKNDYIDSFSHNAEIYHASNDV